MDDTHKNDKPETVRPGLCGGADGKTLALELAALLEDHKSTDVTVLDFRAASMWTDFFVIGTVTSSAHTGGLKRRIKEFAAEHCIVMPRKTPARLPKTFPADGVEWDLTDMGNIVVHLMSKEARDFYDLERLWSAAERIK